MKFNLKKYKSNTLGGLLLHILVASGLLLLIAVTYFYAYLPNVTNHGETITVPNIEGLDSKKAEEFLTRHDLRFEVNDSSYSSQYPPLTVLKQFPSAGAKVKENRKIYVSVNRINPPTVPMPDLINGSLINAEAVLKGSELKRGKIQLVRGPWLNLVQEMRIKGSKVEPNVRVPKGTVVDLVVMDGGGMNFPTPNVLNYSYDEADVSIKGVHLSVGNVTIVGGDTTGMNPVVLKQKPSPGENIRVGDVVDLWIGAPDAEVPDDADSDGN
ncbi:MAG TPA: PASTA domain-containing protein [Chryseosolibacter sp.]